MGSRMDVFLDGLYAPHEAETPAAPPSTDGRAGPAPNPAPADRRAEDHPADARPDGPDVQLPLGLSEPDPLGTPTPIDPADLEPCQRWWEHGDFEDLPEPADPCPTCGSLAWWEDLAGGRHCLTCERDRFQRAERLATKAADLRARATLRSPRR
jgi:hypothetical protein